MTDDSVNWGLLRLRVRHQAYSVIQLFGFTLVFWGLFEVLGRRGIQYYEYRGGVPSVVTDVSSTIPVLDPVTALAVFAAGALIVWFSTQ